jgi:rod shape determining protein RodA
MSFGRGRTTGGLRGLEPVRPALGFRGVKTAVPTLRQASLWRRATARDSMMRHVDWILILAVLALSLIGTLLVWSATAPGLSQAGANPHTYLKKQLLVVVIGLVMMAGVTLIDYRVLRTIAPFAYAAGLLGLLAVLSPLGTTINGSHSWIPLPSGFQIEPSEYAKIGLIMMIALIFGAAGERSARPGPSP